jgi:hypothetical protein
LKARRGAASDFGEPYGLRPGGFDVTARHVRDTIAAHPMKSRALAAGIAVLALATAAAAQPVQTFTVIDRTMVCATAFEGGVPDRLRSLWVNAGRELGQGLGESGASIALGTGRTGSLVYVAADDASSGPGPWLQVTRRRCRTV